MDLGAEDRGILRGAEISHRATRETAAPHGVDPLALEGVEPVDLVVEESARQEAGVYRLVGDGQRIEGDDGVPVRRRNDGVDLDGADRAAQRAIGLVDERVVQLGEERVVGEAAPRRARERVSRQRRA